MRYVRTKAKATDRYTRRERGCGLLLSVCVLTMMLLPFCWVIGSTVTNHWRRHAPRRSHTLGLLLLYTGIYSGVPTALNVRSSCFLMNLSRTVYCDDISCITCTYQKCWYLTYGMTFSWGRGQLFMEFACSTAAAVPPSVHVTTTIIGLITSASKHAIK